MIFIKELRKTNLKLSQTGYPMNLSCFKHLDSLAFTKSITILTGDNGSGKTTLLELIANKLGAVRIGYNLTESEKQKQIEAVSPQFVLSSNSRAKRNFYFSGEEFIQYINWIEHEKQEAMKALDEMDQQYEDGTLAKKQAQTPHLRTLFEINELYANDLIKQSHGQGYLDFFSSRLAGNGVYLLDEPESALTYENQYVLSLEIRQAVQMGCQFIIATHSPVISAIPEASILEINTDGIFTRSYDELDNIRFLQMFLKNPAQMFRDDL